MRILWLWLTGGWRYFRPGRCTSCGRFELVFRSRTSNDAGMCERCWLDFK